MWQFWLIISGFCFILEIITVGFLVFWFGIGALISMIVSLFTDNLIIQTVVFIFSSAIMLFFTRPFVNKFISKKDPIPTNAFSIIGKQGIVIEDIDTITGKGQIKVQGEIWSAKSETNISKDTKIKVVSINGVKALVKPINSTVTL